MEIRILDRWNGIGIGAGTILDFFLTASASQEKRPAAQLADLGFLVAPTGFEPATSALRGRRPKPLDDGATLCKALHREWLGWEESNPHIRHQKPLSYH